MGLKPPLSVSGNGASSSELVMPFQQQAGARRPPPTVFGGRQGLADGGVAEWPRSGRISVLRVAPMPMAEEVMKESVVSDGRALECERTRFSSNAAAEVIGGLHPVAKMEALESGAGPMLELPEDLDPTLMPKHVAIIMDGNSRWAKLRGWSANRGHEAGVQALRTIVRLSSSWGIKKLTVFAFSIENWLRPKPEIEFLLHLFEKVLGDDSMMGIFSDDICIRFVGNFAQLPASLRRLIAQVENRTRDNTGLKLVVALSYSGRQDVVQACQALVAEVQAGIRRVEEIDEAAINDKLMTSWEGSSSSSSDPDLLIRTSGEKRLSNFLLWQMAYTEFVFADELWPDFGEAEYREALVVYQRRERRFGKHR